MPTFKIRAPFMALAIAFIAIGVSNLEARSEPRRPLLEFFTNFALTPGPAAAEAWQILLPAHPEILVIEHHAWWPGVGDPFYLHNPLGQRDPLFYYGIVQLPASRIDGGNVPEPTSTASYEDILAMRLPANVRLQLDGVFDPVARAGELLVTAVPEAVFDASRTLRVALIQDEVVLNPPGPNGRGNFDWLFRRHFPDHDGAELFLGSPPNTAQAIVPFSTNELFGVPVDNLALIAFLQNDTTQEVEQSAMVRVVELVQPVAVTPSSWGRIKGQFGANRGGP